MAINSKQTKGCDKMSRVYGKMFNVLEEVMQDEKKLKELSPLDFSALGMYIGKFVEQEINSSVVQLMRQVRGIKMPRYYCKRRPGRDKVGVITEKKTVWLNEQKNCANYLSLKTIPLGDALSALQLLKKEDSKYFKDYPWLFEKKFQESWRKLKKYRNIMAHTGEIVNAETLKMNYLFFERFLDYMPQICALKKKLGLNALSSFTDKKEQEKMYLEKAAELRLIHEEEKRAQERFNLLSMVFEGKILGRGKKGLKDSEGKVLVPAKYSSFEFLQLSKNNDDGFVVANRDGKFVLVALDGSGRELSNSLYDAIIRIGYAPNSFLAFRKNGLLSWGLMDSTGKEICDCIIDNYELSSKGDIWIESGEMLGYCQFPDVFIPPIYDNIETSGNQSDPLLFTLNGEEGYVKRNGEFIPLSVLKTLEEMDQKNVIKECV